MQTPQTTNDFRQRLFNSKLHRDFMDKRNTCQLTQNNEVIAETKEYQSASRSTVSLKKNAKIPPHSCAVVDMDINTRGNQG